jgi:hypothetical protein
VSTTLPGTGAPVSTDALTTLDGVAGTTNEVIQVVALASGAAGVFKRISATNPLPTRDLNDTGRNAVHYYMLIPALVTATDTLQALTGTKGGLTVAATPTPAVITAGKTLRITRLAASYIATATSGYAIVRLRYNVASLVSIAGPVAATLAVGSGAPVTANSVGSEEAALGDGWEFVAGGGIGISVQGFAAGAAAATGFVFVSVTGYEY